MEELKRDLAEANRRLGFMVKRLAEVQEDVQSLRYSFSSIETGLVKLCKD